MGLSVADGDGPADGLFRDLSTLIGPRAAKRLVQGGWGSPRALLELVRQSESELACHSGLGEAAAGRLRAAAGLGRALQAVPIPAALNRPDQVAELLRSLLSPPLEGLEQEEFHALLLDARHRPKGSFCVSKGTLTSSLVHPREVFRAAVRCAAGAVVVAHNHPSGDPEPSPEDLALTRRLISCGELLGIPLLDHVIVGEGSWVSLRQRLDF